MSLLLNMLSRLFITFLPRSMRLLISCLQSPSAVILEPPKIKSVTVSIASPSRRQWHPTPVLLPGKSHGWRSLVGCSPWGRDESDTTKPLHFHALEKEMATHSSVLAWRIPGMAEPGGLLSMGSHRVGHDWSDLAVAVLIYDICFSLSGDSRLWLLTLKDCWVHQIFN